MPFIVKFGVHESDEAKGYSRILYLSLGTVVSQDALKISVADFPALPVETLCLQFFVLHSGVVMPAMPIFLRAVRGISSSEITCVKVFGST